MSADEKDTDWVRQVLAAHADRHHLDLDVLVDRVMHEVRTTPEESSQGTRIRPVGTTGSSSHPRTPRRRLVPALMAAVSLLVAVTIGSAVPALARWVSQDRGTVVGTPAPSPSISLGMNPPSVSASPSPRTPASPSTGPSLPSRFRWKSSGPLISASAGSDVRGIKDPTVVRYGGRWHVFATLPTFAGFELVYLSFADWSEAATAPQHRLNGTAIGSGYRAAPQVFYFAPQKLWYLVFQTGNASYSTNPDIGDPTGWSTPRDFYPEIPDIIRANTQNGHWLDMWVICDTSFCYLFSSDNRGHLFRSRTAVADFPRGMSRPVVAAHSSTSPFTSSNVYRVEGKNQYLLLSQAYGPDGQGYFRSWTAPRLTGPWTPLADTADNPFARNRTIDFGGTPWTRFIGQGELLREGYDQTLTINPCQLRFLYHGSTSGPTGAPTWKIGLLTQTGSACG
jgi:hypothetical protein